MTAAQSFKIYEVLARRFNNPEDAKIVVTEIEQIIDTKIADYKDILATKEDIIKLKTKISEIKVDLIKWGFTFFAALAVMIMGLYLKK